MAALPVARAWVEQAPVFLVFCADLTRLETACRMHAKEMAKGFAEQFLVATVDTALLAQNAMITAESLGLGGVFIGGIRNDPRKICDLLGIPEKAYPVFGMCLGYPDHAPPVKPRLPMEAIFKTDQYDRGNEEGFLKAYDRVTNTYYQTRDSNLKNQTWTGQMSDFMSQIIRPHMKSFIEEQGFFTK